MLYNSFSGVFGVEPPVPRVRQILDYLDSEISLKKVTLPPKMFTEKYETVKYPYSVTKAKNYSIFGIELEKLVLGKLSHIYEKFFVGDVSFRTYSKIEDCVTCLSFKDMNTYREDLQKSINKIGNFFLENYPLEKIEKVIQEPEFHLKGKITGHPDFVIYLKNGSVVIFDVKVFARMTGRGKDSRKIRMQLAMYLCMIRNMGFVCNTVGVILPWKRDPGVVEYNVSKWKSIPLVEPALESAQKFILTPLHQLKWRILLQEYHVGSHITKKDAWKLVHGSSSDSVPPFHILKKKGLLQRRRFTTLGVCEFWFWCVVKHI